MAARVCKEGNEQLDSSFASYQVLLVFQSILCSQPGVPGVRRCMKSAGKLQTTSRQTFIHEHCET